MRIFRMTCFLSYSRKIKFSLQVKDFTKIDIKYEPWSQFILKTLTRFWCLEKSQLDMLVDRMNVLTVTFIVQFPKVMVKNNFKKREREFFTCIVVLEYHVQHIHDENRQCIHSYLYSSCVLTYVCVENGFIYFLFVCLLFFGVFFCISTNRKFILRMT